MNKFFGLLIMTIILVSCSSTRPVGKTDAEILYKEAKKNVEDERYILATEKLNQLKSQYPYSYFSTHAELLLADIAFLQENYIESAAAYILFRDFHPKNKELSYVIWKTAESYFYQLPSTYDRDLSAAKEALKYYREILTKFPNSKHVDKAHNRILEIKTMLREKDLYIADFYYRTDVYQAARFRYLDIVRKYDKKNIVDLGAYRIIKSSLYLEEYPKCIEYCEQFMDLVSKDNRSQIVSLKEQCQEENNEKL